MKKISILITLFLITFSPLKSTNLIISGFVNVNVNVFKTNRFKYKYIHNNLIDSLKSFLLLENLMSKTKASFIDKLRTMPIPLSDEIPRVSMDDFSIFPNPFHDNISIISPSLSLFTTEILIIDLNGKEFFKKEYPPLAHQIQLLDLIPLVAGQYVIWLNQGENRKFIKILKD